MIRWGIDSDDTINGQVLTSDIDTVTHLRLQYSPNISDLTGIRDFSSLKILNVSGTHLETLDLSENVLLEELYCSNGGADVPNLQITQLDLSNNPNIQVIQLNSILVLEKINLKTGTNKSMTNLHIGIAMDDGPRPGFAKNRTYSGVCIQVDDENAAQQNQYPYSTWVIDDYNVGHSFSENCALGINTFQQENIHVYPNPVQDLLHINTPNVKLEKVMVYNVQGKIINSFSENLGQIDMRDLPSGVYFVELIAEKGTIVKKVVKE